MRVSGASWSVLFALAVSGAPAPESAPSADVGAIRTEMDSLGAAYGRAAVAGDGRWRGTHLVAALDASVARPVVP